MATVLIFTVGSAICGWAVPFVVVLAMEEI